MSGRGRHPTKRVVYMAKRLNFHNGYLDPRGMELKLQTFAYKPNNIDSGENSPLMPKHVLDRTTESE